MRKVLEIDKYHDDVKVWEVQVSLPRQATPEIPAVVREQFETGLAELWRMVARDPHKVDYMILRIRLEQSE